MNPFQANFTYVKKPASRILQAKCVKKTPMTLYDSSRGVFSTYLVSKNQPSGLFINEILAVNGLSRLLS